MGRWAQRRRGGGGSDRSSLIEITDAHIIDGATIDINYNRPVTAGDLSTGDFLTDPTNFAATLISQNGTNGIELIFLDEISFETGITFSGTETGFLTPQTIPFS